MEINYLKKNIFFEQDINSFITDWNSEEKTISVKTSGSTGSPKIIEIEKRYMQASAEKTCLFLQLKSGDSALLCLPIPYISGKMMLVRSLVQNLNLYAIEPSLHPLEAIDFPIDFAAMTPLQVDKSWEKIHLIKKLIIGGASVSTDLKRKIKQNQFLQEKNHIFETYGMSETISHIALKKIYPEEEAYFTTLPQVKIGKDDRDCLWISAPYLGIEKLQTNDIVEIYSENSFLFLGRADYIINSGGAKIFPEQVEEKIQRKLPYEVMVLGKHDKLLGQIPVLVVELGREPTDEDFTVWKKTLSKISFDKKFHCPKEIYFVHTLLRLPNNKLDRRAMYQKLFDKN